MYSVGNGGIGVKVRLWGRTGRDEHADHAFRAASKGGPWCAVAAVFAD